MKRHPDEVIVYGLFDGPRQLERAYEALIRAGVRIEDISLLMREDVKARDFEILEKRRTSEGVAVGGIVGSALGGLIGGLAVLGSAMTGIGLMVVGPMIALGATGSLLGGLIAHGMPAEEAKRLHDALHDGKTLMAVHTRDLTLMKKAEEIFAEDHGEEISVAEERAPTWKHGL